MEEQLGWSILHGASWHISHAVAKEEVAERPRGEALYLLLRMAKHLPKSIDCEAEEFDRSLTRTAHWLKLRMISHQLDSNHITQPNSCLTVFVQGHGAELRDGVEHHNHWGLSSPPEGTEVNNSYFWCVFFYSSSLLTLEHLHLLVVGPIQRMVR